MKRIVFGLLLIICTACGKIDANVIEGVWGLTHGEYIDSFNNRIQEVYDCDPFHPSSDYDLKLSIFNSSDNTYVLTFFYWDQNTETWKTEKYDKYVVELRGDTFYLSDRDEVFYKIKSHSSKTLILEYSYSDNNQSHYEKYIFTRMSDD